METITIKYFSDEDVLFIPTSAEKSSIGDEEYQSNVILYRNTKNHLLAIEIQNFSKFKENKVQVSVHNQIDFSESFKKVKMLISLRDIIFSDPTQFEATLKEWGIEIVKEQKNLPKNISIKTQLSPKSICC